MNVKVILFNLRILGKEKIVQNLVGKGVDVNLKDNQNDTALICAAEFGKFNFLNYYHHNFGATAI